MANTAAKMRLLPHRRPWRVEAGGRHLLLLVRDVTERKRSGQAAQAATPRSIRRLKSEFLANVSHEVTRRSTTSSA